MRLEDARLGSIYRCAAARAERLAEQSPLGGRQRSPGASAFEMRRQRRQRQRRLTQQRHQRCERQAGGGRRRRATAAGGDGIAWTVAAARPGTPALTMNMKKNKTGTLTTQTKAPIRETTKEKVGGVSVALHDLLDVRRAMKTTGDRLLRVWQADNATQKQERVRRAQAGRARRAQRWQAGWVLRRWAHTPEAHDYRRRAVRREGTICDSRRITRSHACNKVRLAKRAHGAAGRARAATCRQKNAAMRVRCCAHAGGSAPHHRRSRL